MAKFIISSLIITCLFFSFAFAGTQSKDEPGETPSTVDEDKGRLFDISVPDGFERVALEEPGMLEWRKGSAQILLIAGRNLSEKPEILFDKLVEAVKSNDSFEKVEVRKLKGGMAFSYLEKARKKKKGLRTWRLVVITDKKILNLDFAAPEKDFPSYVKEFETAMNSFRLRASGS